MNLKQPQVPSSAAENKKFKFENAVTVTAFSKLNVTPSHLLSLDLYMSQENPKWNAICKDWFWVRQNQKCQKETFNYLAMVLHNAQ